MEIKVGMVIKYTDHDGEVMTKKILKIFKNGKMSTQILKCPWSPTLEGSIDRDYWGRGDWVDWKVDEAETVKELIKKYETN